MVYGTYNELVTGAYKPTNITGGGPTLYLRNPYSKPTTSKCQPKCQPKLSGESAPSLPLRGSAGAPSWRGVVNIVNTQGDNS